MYRVDNATAVSPIPAPAAVGPNPNCFFTKGSPGAGTPATIVDDDWANAVQEEICNVVTGAGITLNKTIRTQLLSAISVLAQQATLIKLTGNTTFYVATTGDDLTGNGTVGNPWRTAQKAVNTIFANYHLAGFAVTISRANGAYTDPCIVIGTAVGQRGSIIFDAGGMGVCTVTSTIGYCYESDLGGAIQVQNQKVINTIGSHLYASRSSFLAYSNIDFGACGASNISADRGSVVVMGGPCTISGNCSSHAGATSGSEIDITSAFTLVGTPAFAVGFAAVSMCANVNAQGATFAGTLATGPRFSTILNGNIVGTGAVANFFPGNAVGVQNTGGNYV